MAKNGSGGKKMQGILIGLDKIGKTLAPRFPWHCIHYKGKKQKTHATPPQEGATKWDTTEEEGGEDKMDGTDISLDLSKEANELAPGCTQETESTPLQGWDLDGHFEQLSSLMGIQTVASGVFADLPEDKNNAQLGPTKDLYVGKNFL